MKILRNIFKVSIANLLSFGSSFIVGFILPLVLSVESFGIYRKFLLYLSQIFIFNLGFNDGIYIKYGGKEIKSLDKTKVINEHNFIIMYHSLITLIMLLIAIQNKNEILFYISISIFLYLSNGYFSNMFQSLNEFTYFSRANYFKTIIYIILLSFGVFIFKIKSYKYYILIQIVSFAVQYIYYEVVFLGYFGFQFNKQETVYFSVFRVGFLILIGNMATSLIGNIGSFVVNYFFKIEDFAQYSFQISVLNVILLFVNSVGVVFYNVILKISNNNVLNLIKKFNFILGIISSLSFFVFKFIIISYLPKYSSSIPILAITFLAIPVIITINILINNLYKTKKIEKKYFIDSVVMVIISFIIILFGVTIFKSLISVAIGTVISYYLYYIYLCFYRFSYLRLERNEIFIIFTFFITFYTISNFENYIFGFVLYLLYVITIVNFNKKTIYRIIMYLK